MSEVINVIDKFLKRKLKMNSENEQFWHRNRILFMVTQFIQYEAISLWWQQMM